MALLEAALVRGSIRALAPVLGAAAVFAAGVTAAEIYEHRAPWGLAPKLQAARGERDAWRDAQAETRDLAVAWARSYGQSETARAGEHVQAVAAVNAAQSSCDSRVAAARRAAAAIQSLITKEVPRDAQGCPVRQLADPRELFDALGATISAAAG